MKLVKLVVSLACCLLVSTPLWAASNSPIDEATPHPAGLYALSHLAASGAVTELTDQELATIEGGVELKAVMDFTFNTVSCPSSFCWTSTVVAPATYGQASAKELPPTPKPNPVALTPTQSAVTVLFN